MPHEQFAPPVRFPPLTCPASKPVKSQRLLFYCWQSSSAVRCRFPALWLRLQSVALLSKSSTGIIVSLSALDVLVTSPDMTGIFGAKVFERLFVQLKLLRFGPAFVFCSLFSVSHVFSLLLVLLGKFINGVLMGKAENRRLNPPRRGKKVTIWGKRKLRHASTVADQIRGRAIDMNYLPPASPGANFQL